MGTWLPFLDFTMSLLPMILIRIKELALETRVQFSATKRRPTFQKLVDSLYTGCVWGRFSARGRRPQAAQAGVNPAPDPLLSSTSRKSMRNTISVDVEEYFHPSEVQKSVHTDQWTSLQSLVEPQTRRVLEIFDRHGVKGTFFVLGWVAQRQPALVREIAAWGHRNRLPQFLAPPGLRPDTRRVSRGHAARGSGH